MSLGIRQGARLSKAKGKQMQPIQIQITRDHQWSDVQNITIATGQFAGCLVGTIRTNQDEYGEYYCIANLNGSMCKTVDNNWEIAQYWAVALAYMFAANNIEDSKPLEGKYRLLKTA